MRLSLAILAAFLIAGPAVAAPDDLEEAFQKLKDAESSKNPALVKKLAAETSALARKEAAAPAPAGDDEKEAWKKRVEFAKQVDVHAEYALYATAVQSPPAVMLELLGALEEQNPKSRYLGEAYGSYLHALHQTGAAAKIPAVAERGIANFPDNEDLLLVLADNAASRKQLARSGVFAERLIAVMSKHSKPEGISAADWERKRTAALGRGYFLAGAAHSEANKYVDADKDLRAALPFIKGDQTTLATAYFYLGVANYQLGRMTANRAQVLEAAKFSDQAAAIPGPLASEAARNAHIMRTEAVKIR